MVTYDWQGPDQEDHHRQHCRASEIKKSIKAQKTIVFGSLYKTYLGLLIEMVACYTKANYIPFISIPRLIVNK